MRARLSLLPSRASTSKIPGLVVRPVNAARIGWAACAGLFLLLLSSLFRAPDVPLAGAALLAFSLFAAVRPGIALLAVAAVVPIAAWTGRQWSGAVAWPETVVIAFLAGYAARNAFARGNRPRDG